MSWTNWRGYLVSNSTTASSSHSLTPEQMDEGYRRPIVMRHATEASIEMEETTLRCLVLKDKQQFGAIYIESHLTKQFPIPNWNWIARILSDHHFVIEPPDAEWRSLALSKGQIWLGDVCFPVKPYDPRRHCGGIRLVPVWVKIRGLPSHLWKDVEFERIADEFRGHFMDVDPRSVENIDCSVLRIRLGVAAREDIPKSQRMKFVDDDMKQMSYVLTFEVEDDPQSDVALERSGGASSSSGGNYSVAAWN